jgi:hypothetical protein
MHQYELVQLACRALTTSLQQQPVGGPKPDLPALRQLLCQRGSGEWMCACLINLMRSLECALKLALGLGGGLEVQLTLARQVVQAGEELCFFTCLDFVAVTIDCAASTLVIVRSNVTSV